MLITRMGINIVIPFTVDCPYCDCLFSYQEDELSSMNNELQYIICPQCGRRVEHNKHNLEAISIANFYDKYCKTCTSTSCVGISDNTELLDCPYAQALT